jgi:hypothetical protein
MSKARELANLGNAYSDGALSNRNLIINGAMQVAQRGTSFTAPNGPYTLDRYQVYQANGAVFDVKTSTDAPDGFESSLEIDCTTAAASPAAGAYFQMVHRIEGYNVQQLAYGTSSAKKITLSFYVKSNKTGTYQVNFRRNTAPAQMANKTYTINSADTWERKSITVDGATGFSLTGGNAEGLMIDWWYHSGTSYSSGSFSETYIPLVAANYNANGTANLGDNTSNYLRMTGVMLEIGDTSTPFEHRSYADQLQACQRYYCKSFPQGTTPNGFEQDCIYNGSARPYSGGTIAGITTPLPVTMRATPSVTFWTTSPSPNSSSGRVSYYDGSWGNTSAIFFHPASTDKSITYDLTATSGTLLVQYNYEADAEL